MDVLIFFASTKTSKFFLQQPDVLCDANADDDDADDADVDVDTAAPKYFRHFLSFPDFAKKAKKSGDPNILLT